MYLNLTVQAAQMQGRVSESLKMVYSEVLVEQYSHCIHACANEMPGRLHEFTRGRTYRYLSIRTCSVSYLYMHEFLGYSLMSIPMVDDTYIPRYVVTYLYSHRAFYLGTQELCN